MRRLLLPSVLFVCHALHAQEPAPPVAEPTPPPSQTDVRAQSMRQQIGEGRQVQSHVRVVVRLNNGNRITGVVKDGRLVERVDGLRFVEANAEDKGAGVRIWYTAGARDFVFVPFRDFAEYKIVQKLSNSQLLQVEADLQASLARKTAPAADGKAGADAGPAAGDGEGAAAPDDQDPAAAKRAGDPAAKPKAKGKDAAPEKEPAKDKAKAGAKADDKAVGKEQAKSWFDLVQAYPPEDGWSEARRDELKRRFVVVGSKPNPVEQRFVDEFDEWKKACAYYGVEPAKDGAAAAPEGAGKAKGKDDRKSKRSKSGEHATGGAGETK